VFGMENWYPLLKDFTFPTTLLPLSQEEALAFVDVSPLLSSTHTRTRTTADACAHRHHRTHCTVWRDSRVMFFGGSTRVLSQYQERALKSLDQADLPPVTSPVLKHLYTSFIHSPPFVRSFTFVLLRWPTRNRTRRHTHTHTHDTHTHTHTRHTRHTHHRTDRETRLEGALEDHPCGAFVKLSDRWYATGPRPLRPRVQI
jgi:hypothetical protein